MPPFSGFLAKLAVISAGLDAEDLAFYGRVRSGYAELVRAEPLNDGASSYINPSFRVSGGGTLSAIALPPTDTRPRGLAHRESVRPW